MNIKSKTTKIIALVMALFVSAVFTPAQAQTSVTPEEARAIARDAYVYGSPMVDSYRIQ